eukprot:m.90941 g.90941  ORF g.90941 m.90941 type:complete len:58 (-) comp13281_c1_seq4:209-382(-)
MHTSDSEDAETIPFCFQGSASFQGKGFSSHFEIGERNRFTPEAGKWYNSSGEKEQVC